MYEMTNSISDLFFFFFKQKTAYEMLRSLVGSEMCIRDSLSVGVLGIHHNEGTGGQCEGLRGESHKLTKGYKISRHCCLLYTSDAADEEDSVDLGGRRIIKKKKKIEHSEES
eukprot:TRINITY_DN6675_c0_g1_i1.p1 TRINITY_DN6675_c0_g1~~TRINITY_DN6675_c0_g1_i1.p1  ORF type:complete len:112 (+),score=31.75 TRINITY_DN6675_c0_g1_i1:25-360(+)